MDGPNLENLWVFSWRSSATLRLQGTVLLGWEPLGIGQESNKGLLNRFGGPENLRRGFESLPLRQR